MGEFIAFIFKGVAKALLWLLFRVGLWVPAFFSVIFFVVLAVTGTDFSIVGGLFWFGLVATTVLGIALSVYRFSKKLTDKKKKDERSNQQKIKKDEKTDDAEKTDAPIQAPAPSVTADASGATGYAQGAPYGYPPQFAPYNQVAYPPVQPAQPTAFYGYNAPPQPNQPEQTGRADFIPYPRTESERTDERNDGFIPYGRAGLEQTTPRRDYGSERRETPSFDRRSFAPRESTPNYGRQEPKIYRTRKDPSVLIYDYSDRVEFYRKTESGLTFLYSEKKR